MSPNEETVVEVKPKRPSRKRTVAPGEDAVSKASVKRAPRKVAPKKGSTKKEPPVEEVPKKRSRVKEKKASLVVDASEPEAEVVATETTRKAPTSLAVGMADKKRIQRHIAVFATILFLGVGTSAAVGFTDEGKINVEATIAMRNEEFRAAGNESMVIPVQNTPQLPDGGLVGLGVGTKQEVATSTTEGEVETGGEEVPSEEAGTGNVPLTAAEAAAAAEAVVPEEVPASE